MGKSYDKDGNIVWIQEADEGLQSPPNRSWKNASTSAKPTSKAERRGEDRPDEMALKYAVEMQKLEFERERSEKNRGLAFFALIILAAFLVGYFLFR
jgi:hypothetical protein